MAFPCYKLITRDLTANARDTRAAAKRDAGSAQTVTDRARGDHPLITRTAHDPRQHTGNPELRSRPSDKASCQEKEETLLQPAIIERENARPTARPREPESHCPNRIGAIAIARCDR